MLNRNKKELCWFTVPGINADDLLSILANRAPESFVSAGLVWNSSIQVGSPSSVPKIVGLIFEFTRRIHFSFAS